MKRAFLFLLLLAQAVWAAEVSGAWELSYVRENGQTHVSTLTLKQDGAAVSGMLSSPLGRAAISEGKINGDHISFVVLRHAQYDDISISYEGTIEGDTMKLSMQYGGRPRVEITGKRKATP